MVSPRAVNLPLVLALVLSTSALAQTPPFDKARDAFREGIRKSKQEDRIAGIRELVDTKDVRGTEDLVGAIRTVESMIPKKREEVERIGKENTEAWKPLDDYLALKRKEEQKKEDKQREKEKKDAKGDKDEEPPDRPNQPTLVPKEVADRAQAKAEEVSKRLKAAVTELNTMETMRAAFHDGLGRLLTTVDARGSRAEDPRDSRRRRRRRSRSRRSSSSSGCSARSALPRAATP